MLALALSILLMVTVFSVLGGWAFREQRRRSAGTEEQKGGKRRGTRLA